LIIFPHFPNEMFISAVQRGHPARNSKKGVPVQPAGLRVHQIPGPPYFTEATNLLIRILYKNKPTGILPDFLSIWQGFQLWNGSCTLRHSEF